MKKQTKKRITKMHFRYCTLLCLAVFARLLGNYVSIADQKNAQKERLGTYISF